MAISLCKAPTKKVGTCSSCHNSEDEEVFEVRLGAVSTLVFRLCEKCLWEMVEQVPVDFKPGPELLKRRFRI